MCDILNMQQHEDKQLKVLHLRALPGHNCIDYTTTDRATPPTPQGSLFPSNVDFLAPAVEKHGVALMMRE